MNRSKWLAFFSLFSSTGTLICCALPALFVGLGLGATLAGFLTRFPSLIWFSQHKMTVFGVAGVMLCLGGFAQWQARFEPCPTDPALRQACLSARRWSAITYGVSVFLFLTGGFFAFILPKITG